MNYPVYPFHFAIDRYVFVSIGKRQITKVVTFTRMRFPHMFNLALGDMLPDGRVDDSAISRNGDLGKIINTVIHIATDFLNNNPQAIVFITSASETRLRLYHRILSRYYPEFKLNFEITKLIRLQNIMHEVWIDEHMKNIPFAFLIRRLY